MPMDRLLEQVGLGLSEKQSKEVAVSLVVIVVTASSLLNVGW